MGTWDIILPFPESVQVNCVCDQFVIVGTSTNILRIFSLGGVEEAIILIPGKLITSCSFRAFFAIIFEKKDKIELIVRIYNTEEKKILLETEVCLSSNSKLKWCRFSEEQMILITIDTKNVIRGLFPSWSWSWTPLLNLNIIKEQVLWPVFVNGMKIYYAKISHRNNYSELQAFTFKLSNCKFVKDRNEELKK